MRDYVFLNTINELRKKDIMRDLSIILILFATRLLNSTIQKHESLILFEPRHVISNNVVCATSNASDQPAHTRSLIRVFASRLNIL